MARQGSKGFTLIELMIVIAIIAVLVSLALPAYQDYTIRAKVTEGLSVSAGFKTYIAETCMSNPNANIGSLSLDQYNDVSTYVQILVVGGVASCSLVVVAFLTRNTGAEVEPTIFLLGSMQQGSMVWSCHIGAGDPKHIPANCRNEWVPPIT